MGSLVVQAAASSLVTYAGPEGIEASSQHQVEVNGRPLFVYAVSINPTPEHQDIRAPGAMVYFDFDGSVEVKITTGSDPNPVVVRPLSRGILPVVQGDTIRFTLDRPGNYVVQIGSMQFHPLFLFANPVERDVPAYDDPMVRYFGPGVHDAGLITLESGQTLYLAGGALVKGHVRSRSSHNIRIAGRGILYGGHIQRGQLGRRLVILDHCTDVAMEGVILLDSAGWNIQPINCRNMLIDNVKIIGWRRNSDSIDPVNAVDLTIRNSFLKGHDDGVTLKGKVLPANPTIQNVTVENTVHWQNWMRALVVGGELHNIRQIRNIVFRDLDVVWSGSNPRSQANRDAALSVWNVDNAVVEDVLFENIRVEQADHLVRIAIIKNQHSRTQDYGHVRDITFRNIAALDGRNTIEITGHSADHMVENITFENLRIGGRLIRGPQDCHYVANEFVRNVRFIVTE